MFDMLGALMADEFAIAWEVSSGRAISLPEMAPLVAALRRSAAALHQKDRPPVIEHQRAVSEVTCCENLLPSYYSKNSKALQWYGFFLIICRLYVLRFRAKIFRSGFEKNVVFAMCLTILGDLSS